MILQFPPPVPELASLAGRNMIFVVEASDAGLRLDRFAASRLGLTRGLARELIDFGAVWVGGRVCRRQSLELAEGDKVTIQVPYYGPVRFFEADPARILYQDAGLLAYDKEAGLPCQQTPYDGYNNLFAALKRLPGQQYLALHHRLDAPTSGVMLFARQKEINGGVSRLFSQGPLTKLYLAVVGGDPEGDEWTVDRPISKIKGAYISPENGPGKEARTEFKVLGRGSGRALVRARPLTGRTHQIRLHLAASGLPVLGDKFYGGRPAPRLMLHAWSLSFDHPKTGRPLTIEAPAPQGFEVSGSFSILE